MGKLILLLVLAAGGFAVYWFGFHKSPAYETYLKWTQATMEGDCKTLYSISDGDARKWVDFFCTPQGGMTIMGQVQPGMVAANMVSDLRNSPQGAMRGLRHEIQSEEEAADGTVSLRVVETVLERPSNFHKPAPPRQHDVKLKEVDGAWKILEFKDTEL